VTRPVVGLVDVRRYDHERDSQLRAVGVAATRQDGDCTNRPGRLTGRANFGARLFSYGLFAQGLEKTVDQLTRFCWRAFSRYSLIFVSARG
jgi:hypothetical protein